MTEPTNDEIDALVAAYLGDCGPQATRVYSFARAVLATWGAPPAVAGEPVAWLDPWTGAKATTDYDAYGKHGIPLYTAPQPTQAQAGAVPLTDDQRCRIVLTAYTVGEAIDMVERHHGIKGGQHDAA